MAFYGVAGVWAVSLVAALVAGMVGSEAAVVLCGVMLAAGAVTVAICNGPSFLLRLLVVALVVGFAVGVLAFVLPDAIEPLLAPAAVVLAFVALDRIQRRRRQRAAQRVSVF